MQKLAERIICSGCHACFNACYRGCITMKIDDDGFLYPHIDEKTCVGCGKCKSVCPVLKEYKGNKVGQAYACINKNDDIRFQSSSGGVFTLIAEYVISQNGVVFGAAFGDDFSVKHVEVLNKDELKKLRGSKYLQSTIGNTYKKVEYYLKKGKIVLFSGTPCQISGIKSYLGKEYCNLILLDVICHGVPSPKVWQKYKRNREEDAGVSTQRANFRHKESGWKLYSVRLEFLNGTEYKRSFKEDLFMRAFLSDFCLRPSCYNCHSKSLSRESDITLADFWGVENVAPEMFDDKGTSLVFVNSEKGKQVFKKISENMIYKKVDIDQAVKYNTSAYKSVVYPKNRDKFMKLIKKDNFDKALNKSLQSSALKRIIIRAKIILKKFLEL